MLFRSVPLSTLGPAPMPKVSQKVPTAQNVSALKNALAAALKKGPAEMEKEDGKKEGDGFSSLASLASVKPIPKIEPMPKPPVQPAPQPATPKSPSEVPEDVLKDVLKLE